ncbi:MAG: acetylxylan esterase, partial [Atopobiaceae bacterium]|nr:acetylxylan esterase [Atopobiaceae bacterium]
MGMTPVPADFDAFWQERMAEADAVDLDYEIMPSEIDPFDTVDYLDLWFTGMGGARIYAKYVKPRSDAPVPLVLQFHGYPGS